jgi:hypothetical protein
VGHALGLTADRRAALRDGRVMDETALFFFMIWLIKRA